MKRFITITACAAALLTHVPAAWAGAIILRAASGDIPSGSNCTRQTVQVPAQAPYTAMRCPSTGGSFNINFVYPTDATSPGLSPRLHFMNPDASIGGFYCMTACIGVVKAGQNRNAGVPMQCSIISQGAGNAIASGNQSIEVTTSNLLGSIVPDDTAPISCTTAGCAGVEAIIKITRTVDVGQCPSNAPQNIDFESVTLTYN